MQMDLGRAALIKGGGDAPSYSAEALALFARFTTPPDDARKVVINNLIVALKGAGVWAKFDAFYMMAGADAQAARRNWIADIYNPTAVSSPTFTADRGYTGNGSSSYLNSNFNPATAVTPKLTQNSGHFALTTLNSRAANAGTAGQYSGSGLFISPFYTIPGGTARGGANDSETAGFASVAQSNSRLLVSRTGATTKAMYQNGAVIATSSQASAALSSNDLFLLALNTGAAGNFCADQEAHASIGSGLTAGEVAAYDAAVLTYFQAVGAL